MAQARLAAELLFERYLDAHGYDWEHEPDLAIPKSPDYRIHRSGRELVCEVKQFETQAIRELADSAGGPVVVPPRLLYRTIRNQLDAAASQLRPLADRGLPLVVVLANPSAATVSLDPVTLFHAMYGGGSWIVAGHDAPSIEAWPIPTAAGRDGALTSNHGFISAVVALHERRDPGAQFDAPRRSPSDPPYLHTIDVLSEAAVPLPAEVFDGPGDARWSPDRNRRYSQVAGFVRPGSLRDAEI